MAETSDLAWHYTSLGTLIQILDGKSLSATEVRFQNDPSEMRSPYSVMRWTLKEMGEDPAYASFSSRALQWFEDLSLGSPYDENAARLLRGSRFILCASRRDDSLYAWRTYGSVGSIGCAIGLDRTVPLGVVADRTARSTKGASAEDAPGVIVTTGWQDVEYDKEALTRSLMGELESLAHKWRKLRARGRGVDDRKLLTDGMDRIWAEARSRAKDESYRDEHETRVSVSEPPAHVVKFRDSRLGPRPHVLLGAADAWGQRANPNRNLPIREIMLGPEASSTAVASTTWLLAMHGYIVDGESTVVRFTDENGNTDTAEWTDDSRTVRIRRSAHAYRSV